MDALERIVRDEVMAKRNSEPEMYARRARQVWKLVTGLEPAYTTVRKIERKGSYPHVIVEVDGVRLVAHLKYSEVKYNGFHQWDIAEGVFGDKYLNTDDFTLFNLKDHLKRRRKRLKKRGLYETD